MTAETVLYVDPEEESRERTATALRAGLSDRSVAAHPSPAAALEAYDPADTHAVVTRLSFPETDRDGLDLLASVTDRGSETATVLYTGESVGNVRTERLEGVVAEYVPYGATEALVSSLERALADRSHAAHPLPDDEAERLDVLDSYPLSDPTLLSALDRLTALADDCFDATFVNVHVLSRSEQHSLACRGPARLDDARKNSVCTYAILSEEPTVVPDLTEDARFADRSYVHEHDLDWYVGTPVVVPPGVAIGTFCLLGRGELTFDDAAAETLERFAAEAADQFELARHRADDLRTSEPTQ